jgi:hypothetical protein
MPEKITPLNSTLEVEPIYDVLVLLVSATIELDVCNVWIYVYVHVYEL